MVDTIVATPGAANANSYNTLAEATTYFGNRVHATDWTGSSDDTLKARSLITAALDFNDLQWQRPKYDSGYDTDTGSWLQALAFPWDIHYANNGLYIPIEIKHGHLEQALFSFRLNQNSSEFSDQYKIESFTRGRVSVTYRTDRITSDPILQSISDKAMLKIKPFLAITKGIRLVR
jgi:hypothetical protein